ncbi:phosphoglucomutase (alpha-D-glucose-1,6-bisphosphate-dependent) [Bacterioplanoides sp. SCSIO 12839]|uniref:phosphoglucomutase (alpha-D-glucose-1,6-bisphosphate-dependent) n=1 Tax=Bacterioplanoides sp. SCSIO 12839 TaxID=2829569 RepID=UPI002106FEFE|nr:phosphoglucomutase (alpha-D-glucose-1,6-bisphosphate-dependent) [Bacterioplanoides sp. SCSIO 12839]UTW47316.1 phosphoglucomutase (alpha-D-glucose-1,6-bisphosphate-dependent) [Bacterioplanoides sp. SCSIO 12839]
MFNESVLTLFSASEVNGEALKPVKFGTSGHRGTSLKGSFNEQHIVAIAQAVADYREQHNISGALFVGRDTHALSKPAWDVVIQVLTANKVDVRIAQDDEVTATPLVSHAILTANTQAAEKSDGIIITPSHNPPEDGGIKYNTPDGGPADGTVTSWIENRANQYLQNNCTDVKRLDMAQALANTQTYDYVGVYVEDLKRVIDLQAIASSSLKLGADPMGGTALPVWNKLAENPDFNLQVVNDQIDESFAFMPPDHDGRIRMDCSSTAAMTNLLEIRDQFDLAFGNDPDADRHGIVDAAGLMNPNHYLCVCVDYLMKHRPQWSADLKVGKTLVTSSMMDRVVAANDRTLYEVPVGFKWFVQGLFQGELAFGGEESAGASLLTFDGKPWSTDKDGVVLCLLAAEITAVTGLTPSQYYAKLVEQHGNPHYKRVDAAATPEQKAAFAQLTADSVTESELAGFAITSVHTNAPGNNASIGGLKVCTEQGWFAARPSGTEDIYKIYAESFQGEDHLQSLIKEAQKLLSNIL